MASPLIGITCATDPQASDQVVDRLAQTYTGAIRCAGGLPVILPNLDGHSQTDVVARVDGLLLSGGRDIAPQLYGAAEQHPTVELDLPRDAAEVPLIRAALEANLPILAICRGIQALNVALGGTLYQDLPSERPGEVIHRQKQARHVATHRLRLVAGSTTADALGVLDLPVNSFHHQAVREVAPALWVSGYAEDGLVEALEAPDRPFVVAVQYHPEELVGVCEASRRLFARFVEAARRSAR